MSGWEWYQGLDMTEILRSMDCGSVGERPDAVVTLRHEMHDIFLHVMCKCVASVSILNNACWM